MKCPYCESWIADGSETCPVCRASLPSPDGPSETTPFSRDRESGYRSDDSLPTTAKILVWAGMFFATILTAVIVAVLYFSWRKEYPNKASQLNMHCWLAFFVGIALNAGCVFVMIRGLKTGMGGGVRTSSAAVSVRREAEQFRDYVEVIRRENEPAGQKVTADEATRTIVIRCSLAGKASDLRSIEEFKGVLKARALQSAVFRQDHKQIRELGITIVYRLVTSDGKTIDVSFAPTDWESGEAGTTE